MGVEIWVSNNLIFIPKKIDFEKYGLTGGNSKYVCITIEEFKDYIKTCRDFVHFCFPSIVCFDVLNNVNSAKEMEESAKWLKDYCKENYLNEPKTNL